MRKFYSLITLIIALVCCSGIAKADDFNIGYSYGNATGATPLVRTNVSENSAAVYIPAEYAKTVKGDLLKGVTFYLNLRTGLSSMTAWVRTDLNGENIVSKKAPSYSQKKWNKVEFDAPYTIGEEGFYIGVTWASSRATSGVVYQPWLNTNASWTKKGNAAWTNTEIEGTLCIEGIVSGDNRPAMDLAMISATPDKYFSVSDGVFNITTVVANAGTQTVNGVRFEVGIQGLDPISAQADNVIEPNDMATVVLPLNLPITGTDPGKYNINYVKVIGSATQDDTNTWNNQIENAGEIIVFDQVFPKRVLIEEFTTEKCPKCPAVANMLHNLLQAAQYSTTVDVVCHHQGYYTDQFTKPWDNAYVWFYNANGSTYAPALMVDRMPMSGEPGPVFFPSPTSLLTNAMDERLNSPGFAKVDVDFEVPAASDNTLNVTVTAQRAGQILDEGGILTVYPIEDNIPTTSQANGGSNYKQQHVTRDVNGTWGVPVEWDGKTFTTTHTFTLNSAWVRDNMRVTAVLSHYNSSNPNDCIVYNSSYRTLNGDTPNSGITSPEAEENVQIVGIYDLMGNRHNDLVKGINIVVMSNGKTVKIMNN